MRGSIFKRRYRDGSIGYGVIYDNHPEPGKPRKQKRIRGFRTKKEAEHKLTEIRWAIQNGGYYEPSKSLVSEYADKWLAEVAHRVRPFTHYGYKERLKDYVCPHIGHVPIAWVQPQHVKDLYDLLLRDGRKRSRTTKTGLHPRSVVHVHRILNAMFGEAVRSKVIFVNPCAHVRPPRVPQREQRVLSESEARSLVQAAESSDLYAFVVLALSSGARAGEVAALTWPRIDLESGRITIAYGLSKDGSASEELKTKRSRRSVTLPPWAVTVLKVHRAKRKLALGEFWSDDGFVISDKVGRPIRVTDLAWRFREITKRAHLGLDVHPHTLRHTYASLALKAGVPVTTVAANLGHSSSATTMNVYAHHIPSSEDAAAKALERVLVGAS